MAIKDILSMVEEEIGRLEQARNLLEGTSMSATIQPRKPNLALQKGKKVDHKKHHLSLEGRERIRQAVMKRWKDMKKTGIKSPHLAKIKNNSTSSRKGKKTHVQQQVRTEPENHDQVSSL